jgi:hypothetical protein
VSKPVAAKPAIAPVQPVAAPPLASEIGRLQGITVGFWQEQLERTVTTGQAIMTSPSPVAAARLQMAYVQASLTSGMQHAGQLARLSQEIARDLLRPRAR